MNGEGDDPRLLQAFELIRSIVEDGSSELTAFDSPSHWQLDLVRPPDPGGQLSATDILGWWFQAPLGSNNQWDSFFDRPIQQSGVPQLSDIPQYPQTNSQLNQQQRYKNNPALYRLAKDIFAAEDNTLVDTDADNIVDSLYRFLHAMSLRDVESALDEISEEYHVIEGEKEIDKLGFRQQCELLLDSLYGYDLDISVTEVPEPIPHPLGILIYTTLQIDAHNKKTDKRKTIVETRVAVYKKNILNDNWKMHAFNSIEAC